MEELMKNIDQLLGYDPFKLVLSNKSNKDFEFNKIVFNLKIDRESRKYFQIEKYTDKQVFHENIDIAQLQEKLVEYFFNSYKQLDLWSEEYTATLKISKKGKVFLSKKKNQNVVKHDFSHNKEKNYILKEGMLIEPFIDLGIFTKEGKIVKSKYDKYKQINRFVEIIDDEIKKGDYKELTILDFGCGKSYLTFILYYYFVEIKIA
ncbi:Methyltransferase domain-containing protein [Hathewaya proteolytica DSM 3090]|uniref:Methyltransferase domain-containing protein n=1 Tax=Hathewaya proteolytica DSM 3090 TaxID=1121331 RepID=A0A1M6PBY8_9CLOT|nr:Methyltransferase domain-containing protein [Hathewaya proteolytica DSM 3090]